MSRGSAATKAAHNKRYYADNRDSIKAYRADWHLKNKYGITSAERDAMLAAQGHRCALCHSKEPGGNGYWKVDHCHTHGHVRSILCHNCNVGLGHFNDNPEALEAAAAYLRKHSEPLTTDGAVPGPSQPQRPSGQPGANPDLH